jgi:hypothetical protein
MKGRLAPSLILGLLSLTTPSWIAAQTEGPFARGVYQFLLEDELPKSIDFEARTDARGVTTGQMTFIDQARIPDVEDDESSEQRDAPPELYIKADLDSLTVEKNRAVMTGMVRDSSHVTYIGKWVQLVVEDSADPQRTPDRLTWRLCKPAESGWIPSDAELKDDDGAFLRWWATDAERDDDKGIPSPNLLPGEEKGCPILPLRVYSFPVLLKWEGDIVVQP